MKLVQTPPMGWNSWDCYGTSVTEEIVRANAAFMAAQLKQYGFQYIVIDIQWYEPNAKTHDYRNFAPLEMDEYSRLLPTTNRFPSAKKGQGFKPLAAYIHSLGLKFGIHMMRGIPRQAAHMHSSIKNSTYTADQVANPYDICEWNADMYGINTDCPGAKDYYDSLFELYASWGVDFVKVDDICREFRLEELKLIRNAIDHCGRDIVLSLSPGAAPLEHAEEFKELATMWRMTDDFWDHWDSLYQMFDKAAQWCIHTGEGHFPDCDMLPIGPLRQNISRDNWTNFTKDEQKTMMTLWCMLRSPLMIGGDMTRFDSFTMHLLTNAKVLELAKHSHSAHPLFRRGEQGKEQIAWFATHEKEGYYLALFNCTEQKTPITASLPVHGAFTVHELWSNKYLGTIEDSITGVVASHGAMLYRLVPVTSQL